jgi:hypothetical protein
MDSGLFARSPYFLIGMFLPMLAGVMLISLFRSLLFPSLVEIMNNGDCGLDFLPSHGIRGI